MMSWGEGGGEGLKCKRHYTLYRSVNIHKESNCASADKLSTAALPCYVCCAQ